MFAIDTNILIYAHFARYPQHDKARQFCRSRLFGGEEWCMGWQVVYEYLRITTHPRVHETPLTFAAALADLQPYIHATNGHVLTQTPQHPVVLAALQEEYPQVRGNLMHDCHYAALLRENGVPRLYTADVDFKQFTFLKVSDPTV